MDLDIKHWKFAPSLKTPRKRLSVILKQFGPSVKMTNGSVTMNIKIEQLEKGFFTLTSQYDNDWTKSLNSRPTLMILVCYDHPHSKVSPFKAYIEDINRNDKHNIRGPQLIMFALDILRLLGIKVVSLIDEANIRLDKCSMQLSLIKMVKERSTWYAKYGFFPSKNDTKTICELANYMWHIQISDVLDELEQFRKFLKTAKGDNIKMPAVFGGEQIDYFYTEPANKLLGRVTRVQKALSPYNTMSMRTLLTNTDCRAYNTLMSYAERISYYYIHNDREYVLVCNYVLRALQYFLKTSYESDINSKVERQSTCIN